MRQNNQDAFLGRWDLRLKAVRKNLVELPGVAPFHDALERAYTQTLFNRRSRDVARATAREATRRLQESLSVARDADAALCYFLKGVLGYNSEELRKFGMAPRKKRSRASKKSAPDCELPS